MNILVLTYWSYQDALIQTYTLPYLKQISKIEKSKIFLVCLEQEKYKMSKSEKNLVHFDLAQYNIHPIFLTYERFGIGMILRFGIYFWKLLYIIIFKNIDFIHSFCTPAGALGYILKIFTGKKLILDSYEPHAEAMVESKAWSSKSMAFKILFYLEKKQSQVAYKYIAAASGMKGYALKKYGINIDENNFFVKPACVDFNMFNPEKIDDKNLKKELGLDNKIVCVYAGKLGGIYLEEEVFDFIKCCEVFWGDKFRFLFLTNTAKQDVEKWRQIKYISDKTIIVNYVPHSEIAKYIALADFGITPVKSVHTKQFCTPIKNGEYWAMGLPVVITKDISDDSEIILKNQIGYVLQSLDNEEYLKACSSIDKLLKTSDPQSLKHKIIEIAHKYRSFEISNKIYKEIYKSEL